MSKINIDFFYEFNEDQVKKNRNNNTKKKHEIIREAGVQICIICDGRVSAALRGKKTFGATGLALSLTPPGHLTNNLNIFRQALHVKHS